MKYNIDSLDISTIYRLCYLPILLKTCIDNMEILGIPTNTHIISIYPYCLMEMKSWLLLMWLQEGQILLRNPGGLNYYFLEAWIWTRVTLLRVVIYRSFMLGQFVYTPGLVLGGSTHNIELNIFGRFCCYRYEDNTTLAYLFSAISDITILAQH